MKANIHEKIGEILLDTKDLKIGQNGIAYLDGFRTWDDTCMVYVGGIKSYLNGIPLGENRTIALEDKFFKNRWEISLSSSFLRGKEKLNMFSEIYSIILSKVSDRQWAQFLQDLQSGKRLSFRGFELTNEAFYSHKFLGGYRIIYTSFVKGCSFSDGSFFLHYQKPNEKLKQECLGSISDIPNIHIIQTFIHSLSKGSFQISGTN
jgi:hypothetical protein